ncbi:hypothetical protein EDB89DRAFT_2227701 [Lactarius sanguifluus]|nr:hypothetical protein EDB89DRAFT_2227701 [Lactarius sanguifluus]
MLRCIVRSFDPYLCPVQQAIDDLESFLWVLVWSLVHVFKELAKITNRESMVHRIAHALSSRNFPEILRKEALTREWKDKPQGLHPRLVAYLSETSRTDVSVLQETLLGQIATPVTSQKGFLTTLTSAADKVNKEFIQSGI